MHSAAFRACGMPHYYQIYQASSIREIDHLVKDPHFGGVSVSLPYKTEVIPLLHSLSQDAKAIGAVNTLIPLRSLSENAVPLNLIQRQGGIRAGPVVALCGDNTDWIGVRTCIRRNLSPANAINSETTGLCIGAGGVARASIYAMIRLGIRKIFIYNRTLQNAEQLASHYNSQEFDDNDNRTAIISRHLRSNTDTCVEQGGDIIQGRPAKSIVKIIESMEQPWPANVRLLTVIVSCVPAHSIGGTPPANIKIPSQWLESPTGGVVVEVSSHFDALVAKGCALLF